MFRKLFSTLLVTLFFSATCHAGLVLYENQIWGITDINIEGRLYDFEFLDGSCTVLFNGCDEPSDFLFNTAEKATSASWALINELGDTWVDLGLGGCGFYCYILTPYNTGFYSTDPKRVVDYIAVSLSDGESGIIENSVYADYSIYHGDSGQVWGLWTAKGYVPEPASFMLLLLGLAGLYFSRRRII